jgi:membrane peptidoglycan carboxypeptidase
MASPANATAARLIAEGRARMAGQPEDGRAASRRDRRERPRFDPASLTGLPEVIVDWFARYRHRRSTKLARYTRKQMIWYRLRLVGLAALGIFVVLPVLLFGLGWIFFDIPTPDDAVNKQIATINYDDGTELAKIVPAEGNRVKVSIDQVPKHVQFAVLSAEDRSFFSNPGFDPVGMARAAWRQLTGGVGGGSTITQQFVKKTLVGDEHSLWRKYKEMIIAVKISQQSSKDNILADYLNAIYFGRGAYGIQSASQAYFGKNVWELTPSEGALLAAVIQSPSAWDPAVNPQHALERWTFVMNGMVQQGWLSRDQRAAARFPTTLPPRKISGGIPGDSRGLILNAIRDELEQRGISEQEFNQEGLKITTTIKPEIQEEAVQAATKGLAGQPPNLRGALVSIDPENGDILAYYGGDNGVGLDYAKVSKQPGSTFKPFVLLAALEQQDPIGLGTRFKGEPRQGLRNSDGASCPVCDLKQAMTISNNVVYFDLAQRVGPQKVADAARQAGITSPLKDPTAGIALGNKEVTPVELASAYATIAGGGVYHQPHLVTKVTTSDDRVLYEAVGADERRFSEQVARNVIEGMLGVPTNDKLGLPSGQAVAAKTGTVQSRFEGQNNDAWIGGFTPKIATVVWIGTDQNSPIKNSRGAPIYGNMLPGSIWKSFMSDATKERPGGSFGPFRAIGTPPAVTGQYDGFAAQSAQPAPPPASAFPSAGPLPPDGLTSNGAGGTTGGGDARRDCTGAGCDNQDQRRSPGSGDPGTSSPEQPEPQNDRDTTTRGSGGR